MDAVWTDVKSLHDKEQQAVSEFMIDSLFNACVRTGGGLDAAVLLLRDGKECGPLQSSALQTAAVCAMMKWCADDERLTFEFAVSLVDEWARSALPCRPVCVRTSAAQARRSI